MADPQESFENPEQRFPLHSPFCEAITAHVARVKPHNCRENAMIKQLSEELNVAQQ